MASKFINITLVLFLFIFSITSVMACSSDNTSATNKETSITTSEENLNNPGDKTFRPEGGRDGMGDMQEMTTITVSGTVVSGGLKEFSDDNRMIGNRYTYKIEQADGTYIYISYMEMPEFNREMPTDMPVPTGDEMPADLTAPVGNMTPPSGGMPGPGRGQPMGMGMGQPELSFYADTIQIGDYLEACGVYDETNQTVMVIMGDHYIRTYPEKP